MLPKAGLTDHILDKVKNIKVFVIGSGAIGCELLKNLAMISVASGIDGKITITDPDFIETSNLNRQFLYREKHLRKPKSLTAAEQVYKMNMNMKDHIDAKLDKIQPQTAHLYPPSFYKQQSIILNALDNV